MNWEEFKLRVKDRDMWEFIFVKNTTVITFLSLAFVCAIILVHSWTNNYGILGWLRSIFATLFVIVAMVNNLIITKRVLDGVNDTKDFNKFKKKVKNSG